MLQFYLAGSTYVEAEWAGGREGQESCTGHLAAEDLSAQPPLPPRSLSSPRVTFWGCPFLPYPAFFSCSAFRQHRLAGHLCLSGITVTLLAVLMLGHFSIMSS